MSAWSTSRPKERSESGSDGSAIIGPMPVSAYAHLAPDDLGAIIACLRKG